VGCMDRESVLKFEQKQPYIHVTKMNTFNFIRLSIITGMFQVVIGIVFENPMNLCIGFALITTATMFHIQILESLHSDLSLRDSN